MKKVVPAYVMFLLVFIGSFSSFAFFLQKNKFNTSNKATEDNLEILSLENTDEESGDAMLDSRTSQGFPDDFDKVKMKGENYSVEIEKGTSATEDRDFYFLAGKGKKKGYAWESGIGWLDFGRNDVALVDTGEDAHRRDKCSENYQLVGKTWNPNVGWVNMFPKQAEYGNILYPEGYGINMRFHLRQQKDENENEGEDEEGEDEEEEFSKWNLSGYAWNPNVGWMNFSSIWTDWPNRECTIRAEIFCEGCESKDDGTMFINSDLIKLDFNLDKSCGCEVCDIENPTSFTWEVKNGKGESVSILDEPVSTSGSDEGSEEGEGESLSVLDEGSELNDDKTNPRPAFFNATSDGEYTVTLKDVELECESTRDENKISYPSNASITIDVKLPTSAGARVRGDVFTEDDPLNEDDDKIDYETKNIHKSRERIFRRLTEISNSKGIKKYGDFVGKNDESNRFSGIENSSGEFADTKENNYFIKGNLTLDLNTEGGEPIIFKGNKPFLFVIEGGDLYIKSNMAYSDHRDIVTFVVKQGKNSDGEIIGGNVFIDPSVSNIIGAFYLEGSIMSAKDGLITEEVGTVCESQETQDSSDDNKNKIQECEIIDGFNSNAVAILKNQLLWQGKASPRNTIWGSIQDSENSLKMLPKGDFMSLAGFREFLNMEISYFKGKDCASEDFDCIEQYLESSCTEDDEELKKECLEGKVKKFWQMEHVVFEDLAESKKEKFALDRQRFSQRFDLNFLRFFDVSGPIYDKSSKFNLTITVDADNTFGQVRITDNDGQIVVEDLVDALDGGNSVVIENLPIKYLSGGSAYKLFAEVTYDDEKEQDSSCKITEMKFQNDLCEGEEHVCFSWNNDGLNPKITDINKSIKKVSKTFEINSTGILKGYGPIVVNVEKENEGGVNSLIKVNGEKVNTAWINQLISEDDEDQWIDGLVDKCQSESKVDTSSTGKVNTFYFDRDGSYKDGGYISWHDESGAEYHACFLKQKKIEKLSQTRHYHDKSPLVTELDGRDFFNATQMNPPAGTPFFYECLPE